MDKTIVKEYSVESIPTQYVVAGSNASTYRNKLKTCSSHNFFLETAIPVRQPGMFFNYE